MRRQLLTSIAMIIVLTLVCGLGYSLLMVGIGEAAFGHQANGSFVQQHGKDVGSSLIGQPFTDKPTATRSPSTSRAAPPRR